MVNNVYFTKPSKKVNYQFKFVCKITHYYSVLEIE